MNRTTKILITISLVLCVLSLGVALAAYQQSASSDLDVQRSPWTGAHYNVRGPLEKIVVPTQIATATPGVVVDNDGLGASMEFLDSGTPVARMPVGGALMIDTIDEFTSAGGVTLDSVLLKDGFVQGLANVIAKTGTAVTLSIAEVSGGVISDLGDTSGITITLPTAVAGYEVTIINFTGNDMIIDEDDGDQIWGIVNAAGDSITNSTAYDWIRLVALDATGWVEMSSVGTWADGN